MKKRLRAWVWILVLCSIAIFCAVPFAQDVANSRFRSLHVDAGLVAGEIRSFQGLNGPPSPIMAGLPTLVKQYRELHVTQIRTHDVMGPTEIDSHFDFTNPQLAWLIPDDTQRAGVVKAGNAGIIFPDWSADPEKPESYNFGPSDKVIAAIKATGADVYYRIGRSWGAQIDPPPDFDKYADVVKHIAMHYNQGWANGFHDDIRYWEFWNEPEALFWSGTPEQFYSFYEKTARALKSVDPALKGGGDAIAFSYDPSPYREGFLDYCVAHKVPLDFYSWHTYADRSADPYDGVRIAKNIREILDARGLTKTESILSEWNLTPDFTEPERARLRGTENAAFIGAALTYFQDAAIDHADFYRGDAAWMGLFALDGSYFKTAYTFKAMGEMLATPQRLAVQGADTYGFAVLAGRSTPGDEVQVLISNYEIPTHLHSMEMPPEVKNTLPASLDFSKIRFLPKRTDIVYRDNGGYNLTIDNLPWGKHAFSVKRYRIDKAKNLELVEEKSAAGGSLKLSNAMAPDAVELIVLREDVETKR
jgi:xylan 1,4-beta-xylosidase